MALVGVVAVGAIFAGAFGVEYTQEVVVGHLLSSVLPVVSFPAVLVVDVQRVGELVELLWCGLRAFVGRLPGPRHVWMWSAAHVIDLCLSRVLWFLWIGGPFFLAFLVW